MPAPSVWGCEALVRLGTWVNANHDPEVELSAQDHHALVVTKPSTPKFVLDVITCLDFPELVSTDQLNDEELTELGRAAWIDWCGVCKAKGKGAEGRGGKGTAQWFEHSAGTRL